MERKLQDIETSHTDKVEKGLLKNLLIGYIVAPNQPDKLQILKLLSSVLDFNQLETDKVGLNKTQAGWLSSIVSAAAGGNSSTGLYNIFIKIGTLIRFIARFLFCTELYKERC